MKHNYIAVGILCTTAFLFNCKPAQEKISGAEKQFDIPTYISNEIQRLSAQDPTVSKTVVHNSEEETKSLKINNWENELAAFKSVNINKPAYRELIKKDSTQHTVTLTFAPNLDLTKILIRYNEANEVDLLEIYRSTDNLLYQTEEVLSYKKNAYYAIQKEQKVWLMSKKSYKIKADFL